MGKYKIGITEAGDAGVDFSWENKLTKIDGAILITKNISPEFIKSALRNKNKIIIHSTITGFGGSVLEPNVPSIKNSFQNVASLIDAGFPKEKIVVRVDPIIPTPKGIESAKNVFKMFMGIGLNRYRISLIDMYPHVRKRFQKQNLPLPYNNNFYPSISQVQMVDNMIYQIKEDWSLLYNKNDLRIESCAEPNLKNTIQCGCISQFDLKLLGLNDIDDSIGFQRKDCLCYSGKIELLNHKIPCKNGCIYCYWKDKNDI